MSTERPRVVPAPDRPAGLDAPDAWGIRAYLELERSHELDVWGWTDLWTTPEVLLGALRHQEYHEKLLLAALPAGAPAGTPERGDVVGAALVTVPRDPAAVRVSVRPRVSPPDAVVTDALLAAAEAEAVARGRTTVTFSTVHSPEPAPGPGTLVPPTGEGRVPADAPAVRAGLARGYALEQVTRHSTLRLPVAAATLDPLDDASRAAAGDGYRLHTWRDDVPADRLDDLATLWTRMSTDAPAGGVDVAEERWDAAHVRTHLADVADRAEHLLLTAAEDVASGRLVAFTALQVPFAEVPFAFQEDTLVLREHRGRRLGMLVKVANLRALAAWRPGVTRVHTWNAQENAHMLGINVALGFAPDGVLALWQKRFG